MIIKLKSMWDKLKSHWKLFGGIGTGTTLLGVYYFLSSWDSASSKAQEIFTVLNISVPIHLGLIIILGFVVFCALRKYSPYWYLRVVSTQDSKPEEFNFRGVKIVTEPFQKPDEAVLLCEKCRRKILGATVLASEGYLYCENNHVVGNLIPYEESLKKAIAEFEEWQKATSDRNHKAELKLAKLKKQLADGEITQDAFDKILHDAPRVQGGHPFVPKDGNFIKLSFTDFSGRDILNSFIDEYNHQLLLDRIDNNSGK